ncbi:hypothetical protein [Paracoccus litorisediminis]|uniref:Uncharacterized protein n=1 Tax=Paracoccus litorisediminis TaxID=2006130 RepID=A0A844HUF9_9RHOB|nr:hypothetical protein [Paracoccus litorisediminis]MTH61142.1 hypothetical protein [Paracoccus litorisediminis]
MAIPSGPTLDQMKWILDMAGDQDPGMAKYLTDFITQNNLRHRTKNVPPPYEMLVAIERDFHKILDDDRHRHWDALSGMFSKAIFGEFEAQREYLGAGPSRENYEWLEQEREHLEKGIESLKTAVGEERAKVMDLEEGNEKLRKEIAALKQEIENLKTEAELRSLPTFGMF